MTDEISDEIYEFASKWNDLVWQFEGYQRKAEKACWAAEHLLTQLKEMQQQLDSDFDSETVNEHLLEIARTNLDDIEVYSPEWIDLPSSSLSIRFGADADENEEET
jgi:hypothetical protein